MKLAVIGKDVSRSTSPQMHSFIAENMGNAISYESVSIPESQFESIIENLLAEYDGLNVTIPYKLSVIPHLNKIADDAALFGAVNTVLTSTRTGYNTDGLGFMLMLKNNGVEVKGKRIALLGAGGAGRAVAKKLAAEGAEVFVYDKFSQNAVNLANEFGGITALDNLTPSNYDIVINATGIGMHNTEGVSPVDGEFVNSAEVAVDLIYVPEKSEFLRIAQSLGKKIINGQAMLFYQAYYAQCIYFNLSPDENQAKKLFEMYIKEVQK